MEDDGDHAHNSKNRELRIETEELRIARKTLAWLWTRFVWLLLWLNLVILLVKKSFLWALLFLRLFLDLGRPFPHSSVP